MAIFKFIRTQAIALLGSHKKQYWVSAEKAVIEIELEQRIEREESSHVVLNEVRSLKSYRLLHFIDGRNGA